MPFPLFRRQRAPVARRPPAPPVQPLPGGRCLLAACARAEGWRCSYVDASGAGCQTWWCPDHALLVEGRPFCRRHAGVAELLVSRVGSLFELPLPRVDDRALPLLLRLTEQLDTRAVHLMRYLYRDRAGVLLSPHANVREAISGGRHQGWEALWTATGSSGYLTNVVMRVTADEPPHVQLHRDGVLIFDGVPGWIAQRDESGWHRDDSTIADHLYSILLAGFGARV